jgi:hypothetical protein
MITRDSVVWTVAALASAVGYLVAAQTPPWEWSYPQWLQAATFVLAWLSGKLATSQLAGANDPLSRTTTVLGVFSVKEK